MPLAFVIAHPVEHRETILRLNVEYLDWVREGIVRMFGSHALTSFHTSVQEDASATLEKLCRADAPEGVFYLLELQDQPVGMCALRRLHGDVAEFKRVYIRQAFRGMGLGRVVLQRLLSDARALGCRTVCLDTAEFMHAARRLYLAHGFVDCLPHGDVEVPRAFHHRWHFMQRSV
ncbi:GNAT family N-acetyltransferase [Piscinibacter terrae]|nr:GNAT family N-acetyltransferase [Albitalea terrae]